jgi:hypothetical protein
MRPALDGRAERHHAHGMMREDAGRVRSGADLLDKSRGAPAWNFVTSFVGLGILVYALRQLVG